MTTPFTATGALDLDDARHLADHLVPHGCDGLVLSGTTGESPTTTDAEKSSLVEAVREAVGPRATVVVGIGTPDTATPRNRPREAEKTGADALLTIPNLPAGPLRPPLGPAARCTVDGLRAVREDRAGPGTALGEDRLPLHRPEDFARLTHPR